MLMINKVAGTILIALSISVAIPLTLKTIGTGGGPWGFGIIGLPILLPLSAYVLFGFAPWFDKAGLQRVIFITAHGVTISIGLISLFIFPVYPIFVVLIPVALAFFGLLNKTNLKYYLFFMILLAITANLLLLKWEIDFDRTLPLLQLFQTSSDSTG